MSKKFDLQSASGVLGGDDAIERPSVRDAAQASRSHLKQLRENADRVLAPLVPRGEPCALLDFPDHSNVGDSAIWLGERSLLRRYGVPVVYACSHQTWCERVLRCSLPRGTVLLHGGGNFGSLWPRHHQFRLEVLEKLRDYRVVQLPQTLHFEADDQAGFDRSAELIAAHPDFTLLVRDVNSLRLGERLGARSLLCPDSAHFLDISRPAPPRVDCFVLARSDKESRQSAWQALAELPGLGMEQADWLVEPPMWLNHLRRQFFLGAFRRSRTFQRMFQPAYLQYLDALSRQRVRRGIRQLSRGSVVVTDRLHAHILCSLLEIPNVVLDNSYGKVHDYMRSWTQGHPLCHPVRDIGQAQRLMQDLLRTGS
ncbi:MAG: polysaccharide pyruvyl transferase family protein [Methylibium sp.]|nr:polysaccharide pyruvyl transferase family protein [Methylibium sp.]